MSIYLFSLAVIILSSFLIFLKNQSSIPQKIFLITIGLFLVLISGLRSYSVGVDTLSYMGFYDMSRYLSFDRIINGTFGVENGYLYYNKMLNFISESPQFMLIINALVITTGILYFIYKNSPNVTLSVYLYITLYYFAVSLNIMRQFIALSIFLIALEQLKKNRWLTYIIIIYLSSLIHESALICLPVVFIHYLKPTIKNMIWIFCVAIGSTIFVYINPSIVSILSGSYSRYVETTYFEANQVGGTIIIWIVQIAMYFSTIYILKSKKHILGDRDKKLMFLSAIMILISVCIGLIGTKIFILSRMIYSFDIFMIILIPLIIKYTIKEKKLALIAVYLVLLVYFVYNLSTGGSGVVPYQFFWQA